MSKQPNIVLIMTDQHRGDALSIDGHPDVMTPNMDQLAARGARFRHAYTPSPVCSAARQALMTGRWPANNGQIDNSPCRILDPESTLPNLLRTSGYQTAMIGRGMHQYPGHARYGFETVWIDPYSDRYSVMHDKIHPLSKRPGWPGWPHRLDHAVPVDGYTARPWPYEEWLHQSNWATSKAVEFLDTRDRDQPFFLSLGYTAPHPPLVPPACYYDRYMRMNLRPPFIGDWTTYPERSVGLPPDDGMVDLKGELLHSAQAGYYGLINHVDDQLHNLWSRILLEREPTYVLYTSDHGEQLGDHYRFRKCQPYQGSVRIPFFLNGPGIDPWQVRDEAVSLIDVLPTLCELADVSWPDHVDGRSLLPLMRGDDKSKAAVSDGWRPFVHSEYPRWHIHTGFHTLTNGQTKYIRFGNGSELLFDLGEDPHEMHNLAELPGHRSLLETWRAHLIDHLRDRPEGFVQDGELVPDQPHVGLLPHARPV